MKTYITKDNLKKVTAIVLQIAMAVVIAVGWVNSLIDAQVEQQVAEELVLRGISEPVAEGQASELLQDIVSIICPEGDFEGTTNADGSVSISCLMPFPSPTPTLATTLTLVPTFTPCSGRACPTPTPTGLPGTSTPPPTQIGSLPLCSDHDPNVWHALISKDGSCHYDHEHKEDPGQDCALEKFGQPGTHFGQPGVSISYPWQTHEENLYKHPGYGTIVRCNMGNATGADVWINSVRIQAHFDMLPFLITLADGSLAWSGGFLGRQHSYWNEIEGCSSLGCGLAFWGGHLNYGNLEIRKGNEVVTTCALPDDPGGCPPGPGGNRIHFDNEGFPPTIPNRAATTFWYGEPHPTTGSSSEFMNPLVEAFAAADLIGEVSPEALINPLAGVFCPLADCEFNGSTITLHAFQFTILDGRDGSDLDEDGEVNGFFTMHAFSNVYGVIDETCTAVTETCVPMIFEHFPVGSYNYRDTDHGIFIEGVQDYDLSPDGEHWITWFATMIQQLELAIEGVLNIPILYDDMEGHH